ncbi:hypothetical protein BAU15_11550 [Enterococcus sp. JM4C]|uniref:N-acetylglucosamine kinase n=1 Tax=Candidatus Enterococcus huntleyi TaxID=1857217 RepID=UPI00137A9FB0|nr:BadF/BadG/BcrA/BcrD ATPase family protein [Enterococcus sp. JM4C]KAF1297377.1 hypothetical protein BAU15_11550 [Enterococcus sp. JM4C]
MISYIIGVDSGGTKTQAAAYTIDGELLNQCTTGFGNPLVDYETGVANINQAIETIISRNGNGCQLIVIGLAGLDSSGLKVQLEEEFSQFEVPLVMMNDGQLAHLSILKGKDGILVISGTGSLVLGYQQKQWLRVGGWGHLFGDEGSAYDIAKRAIQYVLSEADAGQPFSEFSLAIFAHFHCQDVYTLVKLAYQLNKGELAELAALVGELGTNNLVAQEILQSSGQSLARQVIQLAKRMTRADGPVLLGLNGSVVEKNEHFKKAFFDSLTDKQLKIMPLFKSEPITKGAYYYYKEGWQN